MKCFGIICIVLGGLGTFSALLVGNSAFGPFFWLALGIALVYNANKKEEKQELSNECILTQGKTTVQLPHNSTNDLSVSKTSNSSAQYYNVPLTQEQKEAAICLISFFAGFNDDVETNVIIYQLMNNAAIYLGILNYPEMLPHAMSRNNKTSIMIDRVKSITDTKSKECTLLVCYDLANMSGKAEAQRIILNIADEIGYNKQRFHRLVSQYSN